MKREITETTLRGLIGVIPYAGTLLNEVVFEHRSRIKQNRIEKFILSFSDYLKNFSKLDVDIEHIKSEEFSDIFENLILKVSKNRSEKKLDLFKKILKSEISNPFTKSDFVEIYLDLIDDLHEKQIEIIKEHYLKITISKLKRKEIQTAETELSKHKQNIKKEIEKAKNGKPNQLAVFQRKEGELVLNVIKKQEDLVYHNKYRNSKYYDLNNGNFSFFIQDLVSKSLLFDEMIGAIGHENNKIMDLTDFGKDFIDFITK
ncbi:hypothetical protein [Tenacibaculum finnmarkense]|uniref:hypothetical protein n=1 Tax=Tenacibaculum finnmarkense TaxID=2781243 RepID=UPI002301A9C3|nr:hypothetical protein [Tenacibaculum finnmarkense]WCC46232.1 hypothetical protein PJH08_07430 [Tenacibaculum finnmarkense]